MTAELGSRSDLEALQRSGRGKVVVVVLLLILAVGGAAWSFLREEGIGDAEDPTKVIVVSRGTTVGYSGFLKDLGFDAAEGTLAAWQTKAQAEVEGLEDTGVEAVLALADKYGYGYVVFEDPSEVDFSGLDIEGGVPQMGDDVRFGVLSVGDFAFPHRLTVNPEPSAAMRDPGMSMLQALFEQEELSKALPEHDNPEISTIQLRDRLRDALDHLERIPAAEEMVERVMAEVNSSLTDQERADPQPELLTDELESATPLPLPSGVVMTLGRQFSIVTRDAVRADLELDDAERFYYATPAARPDERKVCTALAGGEMSVDDSARYAFAADGGAIVIKNLSEGLVLWRSGTQPGSCSFEKVGVVPAAGPGIEPLGVPHSSGAIARPGVVDGRGVVEIVTVADGQSQLLGMLDGVELRDPVWLSDRIVAVIGQEPSVPDAIYLLDTDNPLLVLRLEAAVFENATDLGQLAPVPGMGAGRLVVSAGSFPRKLYRLDAPTSWLAVLDDPPRAEPADLVEPLHAESDDAEAVDEEPMEALGEPPGDQGLPEVVDVDPNAFSTAALTHAGQVFDPVVSPDGTWVAMGLRDRDLDRPDAAEDDEIALARLDGDAGGGAKLRLVTRNGLRDHSARFTSDGAWVVFETRIEIPRTDWAVTAARRARVLP